MRRRTSSKLENRIRHLEKESSRLDNSIRTLSRRIQKGDPVSPETPRHPAAPTPQPRLRPAVRHALPHEATEAEATTTQETPPDLFSWSRQQKRTSGPAAPPTNREQPEQPSKIDRRMASYLTSGSFSPVGQKQTPRPIQRTRAVFMVIIVIVVAFIVFKLLWGF